MLAPVCAPPLFLLSMTNSHVAVFPSLHAGQFFPQICVLDSGYDLGHEDLPNASHGVDGYSPYQKHYADQLWDVDGNGHGTHVAGTIGAIGGNGIGVTSVNPDPNKFTFFIGKAFTNENRAWVSYFEEARVKIIIRIFST